MPRDHSAFAPIREHRRKVILLLVHSLFTTALVAAGFAPSTLRVDFEDLVYPSCVLLMLMFVWILWSWFLLRKTLFEPYPLFIAATGLFNGGQAFLEVFGLNEAGILDGRFSADALVPALYLVTTSAAFLHIGALAALGRTPPRSKRPERSQPNAQLAARLTGLALLGISVIPTVILLRQSVSLVMDTGYMGLYRAAAPLALTRVLSGFLIPGAIFLLMGSRGMPKIQAVCFAVVSFYAFIYLFLGARAAATTGCVAVGWAFDRSVRHIPRKLILVFGLVALVLFGLVQQTRRIAGRDRLSLASEYEAMTTLKNPLSTPVAEMGGSLLAVTHTIRLVPDVRGFDLGASYWYALLTIVPNLGWDVHPSVTHGLLADWLVKTVDPVIAATGGGLGYSFIAEAYLNFGWFGAPVSLAIFGYFLCRVFLLADSADLAKQALIACFLASILVFPRGEAAISVRGLIWYAVIPYLLMRVLVKRGRRLTAVLAAGGRREDAT
jgi:oligosaccharide repeat unit polymerase